MAKRKSTKTKTIAQRIAELEDMVASFFTGAAKTTKASTKRTVKRAKAGTAKRVTKAKRVIKRTARTARRKAAAIV